MIAAAENELKSRVKAPILVVDDDENILDFVVMSLEFMGFDTESARDGAEALEILERDRPGLVLLDMRMPRLDGWGFARKLAERGIDIPVVVMTAARDARRWAEEIDADDFLEKPFGVQTLIETVDRVLRGRK
jgi:two-component system, chemotaxis family, chemotaxis protein CheY